MYTHSKSEINSVPIAIRSEGCWGTTTSKSNFVVGVYQTAYNIINGFLERSEEKMNRFEKISLSMMMLNNILVSLTLIFMN